MPLMGRFNACHDKCRGGGVGLLPCVQLQCIFVITRPMCPNLMGRYDYKEGHGMNKFHTGMQAQAQDPIARCLHVCLC